MGELVSQGFIYIGAYLQLLDRKDNFDLDNFLVDKNSEVLQIVPSECFDVNYTLVISNESKCKAGRLIDCENGGSVLESNKIDIEAETTKFKNKYGKLIAEIEKHYEKVQLRHGIIYYVH